MGRGGGGGGIGSSFSWELEGFPVIVEDKSAVRV